MFEEGFFLLHDYILTARYDAKAVLQLLLLGN